MLTTIDQRGSSVENSISNVFSSRSVVNAVAVNAGTMSSATISCVNANIAKRSMFRSGSENSPARGHWKSGMMLASVTTTTSR